jgi:hypothetical protein
VQAARAGGDTKLAVAVGRRSLALGDYQWVLDTRRGATADDADETSDDVVFDSADMDGASVLPYVVERKTMKDIAGRSLDVAHLKQLRRLRECELRHTFLLLEGEQHTVNSRMVMHRGGQQCDAAVVASLRDLYAVIADCALTAVQLPGGSFDQCSPRLLETTDVQGTLRTLTAVSLLAHFAADEEAGGRDGTTLRAFGSACRSDMRRLSREPMHVALRVPVDAAELPGGAPRPFAVTGAADDPGPTPYDPGAPLMLLHYPAATFVTRMLELYEQAAAPAAAPAPAPFGTHGAVRAISGAAAAFACDPQWLPQHAGRGTVLVIEGMGRHAELLKKRACNDRNAALRDSVPPLARRLVGRGGGGLLELIELFVLCLTLHHGVFIKRTRSREESELFALVVHHKCTDAGFVHSRCGGDSGGGGGGGDGGGGSGLGSDDDDDNDDDDDDDDDDDLLVHSPFNLKQPVPSPVALTTASSASWEGSPACVASGAGNYNPHVYAASPVDECTIDLTADSQSDV